MPYGRLNGEPLRLPLGDVVVNVNNDNGYVTVRSSTVAVSNVYRNVSLVGVLTSVVVSVTNTDLAVAYALSVVGVNIQNNSVLAVDRADITCGQLLAVRCVVVSDVMKEMSPLL